jgi:GNAT superfamily N-acetyltransferase
LSALIAESARVLSRGFYTPAQIEAAIEYVFGVDTRLVDDGTYYAVEAGDALVACGGWSRRGALYGGDQRPMEEAPRLDPARDAARVRAFFVAPAWARQGLAGRLLDVCARAAAAEGFRTLELMATLPGVPFYARHGFAEVERVVDRVPSGAALEFVRMVRGPRGE